MRAPHRPIPARGLAVLVVAFGLQNLEESLFLPGWATDHGISLASVDRAQMGVATGMLTVVVAVLLAWAWRRQDQLATGLVALVAGALLANTATHLVVSVVTASLMPGTPSGLVAQGPAALWVLAGLGLPRGHRLAAVVAGLALSVPAVFASRALAGMLVP